MTVKTQYEENNKKRFFSEWLGISLEFGDLELSKFLLEDDDSETKNCR